MIVLEYFYDKMDLLGPRIDAKKAKEDDSEQDFDSDIEMDIPQLGLVCTEPLTLKLLMTIVYYLFLSGITRTGYAYPDISYCCGC